MATTVKCKTRKSEQAGVFQTACGCGPVQSSPCYENYDCNVNRRSQSQAPQSSAGTMPIIVQAPAAPIIIRESASDNLVPVLLPLMQTMIQRDWARSDKTPCEQQKATMPVQNSQIDYPTAGQESPHASDSQTPSSPVVRTPMPQTTPDASRVLLPGSEKVTGDAAGTQSDATRAQPIVINITNSQDRDSCNRNVFAPRSMDSSQYHDESVHPERIVESKSERDAASPSSSARVHERRGRVVRVRQLRVSRPHAVTPHAATERAQQTQTSESASGDSLYHYVGWS